MKVKLQQGHGQTTRAIHLCGNCGVKLVDAFKHVNGGHLKRWMEDATDAALCMSQLTYAKRELTPAEESDLQAAAELAALENAAREALLVLEMLLEQHPQVFAVKEPKTISNLRSALKAL